MPRGKRRRCGSGHINDTLQDDALAAIFARLAGPADVVRCAATCTRWMRVVGTRARSLPPLHLQVGRFLPQLVLGVFHLEKDGPTSRTRRQPRFHAMAASSSLLLPQGCQKVSSIVGSSELDYSRPVASRSGRLVLELQRHRSQRDILRFCVCNPMTGWDLAVLPALSSPSSIKDDYGCALLTGDDDLRRPRRGSNFFRLLLVYHRHGSCFTALRCYSSDTGRWGPETRSPVNVSSLEMRRIGQAVVLHGAAFWPLDQGALAVRPADDDHPEEEVHLLPYDFLEPWRHGRLLGISPDNRLFFIYFGFLGGDYTLIAKISYFHITGDDIKTGYKERSKFEEGIRMPQMKMTDVDNTLKLRWIGERSGVVVFTMGGGCGHTGAFALNMREGTVVKLADEGHVWGNVLGFEMDWGAYLASIAQHH